MALVMQSRQAESARRGAEQRNAGRHRADVILSTLAVLHVLTALVSLLFARDLNTQLTLQRQRHVALSEQFNATKEDLMHCIVGRKRLSSSLKKLIGERDELSSILTQLRAQKAQMQVENTRLQGQLFEMVEQNRNLKEESERSAVSLKKSQMAHKRLEEQSQMALERCAREALDLGKVMRTFRAGVQFYRTRNGRAAQARAQIRAALTHTNEYLRVAESLGTGANDRTANGMDPAVELRKAFANMRKHLQKAERLRSEEDVNEEPDEAGLAATATVSSKLQMVDCRWVWQEHAMYSGFRDTVSASALQELARHLCKRSPTELARVASTPNALLGSRVQVRLPQGIPKGVWFANLLGREGTVQDSLSGNSVSDLRVPVQLDNGMLLDMQVEYLRPIAFGNRSMPRRRLPVGGSMPRRKMPIGSRRRRTARNKLSLVTIERGATVDSAGSNGTASCNSSGSNSSGSNSSRSNSTGSNSTTRFICRNASSSTTYLGQSGLKRGSPAPPRFLTVATSTYFHWLCHLHANLQMLGYRSGDLGVCVFDNTTEQLVRSFGMQPISLPQTPALDALAGGAATFGSKAFVEMALGKQRCIWETLRELPEEEPLIFLDGDITLLSDPFPLMPAGFDLVLTDDTSAQSIFSRANIGFFMARNTERMRLFAKSYLERLRKESGRNDQDIINSHLRERSARFGLQTYMLDPTAFVNGYYYYEYRASRRLNVSRLAAVHHNFISGDGNKWNRTVEYGGIIGIDEPWARFRQRMLRAATSVPEWSPPTKMGAHIAPARTRRNHVHVAATETFNDANALKKFWSNACARPVYL